jgi:hypothetical protein
LGGGHGGHPFGDLILIDLLNPEEIDSLNSSKNCGDYGEVKFFGDVGILFEDDVVKSHVILVVIGVVGSDGFVYFFEL